ncbi:MAG TPA: hypothetical protein VFC63_00555, partial [Blastocatellia bacterium]|nr:hypothetical protein [Blastocatellia bacterium]
MKLSKYDLPIALLSLLIVIGLWGFSTVKGADEDKGLENARNLISGWMATVADEPPHSEQPAMRGVIKQAASLEENAGPLGSAANLASGLMLWTAERAIEQGEKQTKAQNYHFLIGMREQLPKGSSGIDVVVLGDKDSGRAMVCFTADYYKSHHDEIRKQYPAEKYNVMQSDSPWLNFQHLAPLADSTPVARDSFRRVTGPIVNSDADLKEQKTSYWAPDPHPLTIGPAFNPTEYTMDQMQRDIEANKSVAQSIIAYESEQRGEPGHQIGGVALGGRVRFPQGISPNVLYLAGRKLHLKSGSQDFEIDGVDPSEFAILMRSLILTERPPMLSIGTESSDKAGYQRVTYFSSIRNSSVGAGMLAADLRLKGLLAGIGMGIGGSSSGPSQDFLWTFPRVEGLRWMRMWLVGGDIDLVARSNQLTATSSNLTLHYEMALRDRPIKDQEVDRFVNEFNRRWPALAGEIPAFRHLEQLALTSALAAWVKESKCVVAPDLWLLPFEYANTPTYVPACWSVSDTGLVTVSGGIDLSGSSEMVKPTLGTMMPLVLQSYLFGGNSVDTRIGWLGLLLFIVIGCGAVLLVSTVLRHHRPEMSFVSGCRRALAVFIISLVVLAAIDDIAAWIINLSSLGSFDAEFISLAVAVLVPPIVLRFVISQGFKRSGAGSPLEVKRMFSLGAAIMLALVALSGGLDMLFISTGLTSSAKIQFLNAVAAPVEIVSRPWASR